MQQSSAISTRAARALTRARRATPTSADGGLLSLADELGHILSFLCAAELARAACVCTSLSKSAIAAAELALCFKDLASPAHNSIRALDVEEACTHIASPCDFWKDSIGGIVDIFEEVQGQNVVHLRSMYPGHWRTAVSAERFSRTTCLKLRLKDLRGGPILHFGLIGADSVGEGPTVPHYYDSTIDEWDPNHLQSEQYERTIGGGMIHSSATDYCIGDELIVLFCPRQRELRIRQVRPIENTNNTGRHRIHPEEHTFVIRDLPREDYRFIISLCSGAAVTICRATPAEHALCYGDSELVMRYDEVDDYARLQAVDPPNSMRLNWPYEGSSVEL